MMKRRSWLSALVITAAGVMSLPALAQEEAPDALVKRISSDVLASVKADPAIQAGDVNRIVALVDTKIMPSVNFTRMTSSAVGRFWRQATPEQQKQLQDEFKILLVRTYSGALGEVKDQTVTFKPMRSKPEDTEVVVRSEVRGKGDPIQLDYRMEKTGQRLEDLRPERAGRLAGGNLPHPVRAGNQRQGHRRPDRLAGPAQQVQRRPRPADP